MSTVLWANVLLPDGQVISAEEDLAALYRHAGRLDRLARRLGLASFEGACDLSDVQFNLGTLTLPEGMESSQEWMARHGAWLDSSDALRMLEGLASGIHRENVRFGLLRNQQAEVLEELEAARKFLLSHSHAAARFNFVVVT